MLRRADVQFQSGDARYAACLYLPDQRKPHPVIVMAHGLGGTREMRLDAYAEKFVPPVMPAWYLTTAISEPVKAM